MTRLAIIFSLLFVTPAWAGKSHWLFEWTTLGQTSAWYELFDAEAQCKSKFDEYKKEMGFVNERFVDRRGDRQIGPSPYFFAWYDSPSGEHKLQCIKLTVK